MDKDIALIYNGGSALPPPPTPPISTSEGFPISYSALTLSSSSSSSFGPYFWSSAWQLSEANGYGGLLTSKVLNGQLCGSSTTQPIQIYFNDVSTYTFTDNRGVPHTFGVTSATACSGGSSGCASTLSSAPAEDGSGFLLAYGNCLSAFVTDPSGNTYGLASTPLIRIL